MIPDLSLHLNTIAILLIFFFLIFRKRYLSPGMCRLSKDLTGQVIVITGANTGIGKETAYALAKMNANVIIAAKDPKKGIPVVKELQQRTDNMKIEYIQLDLADLKSIRLFVKNFKNRHAKLHMLINNAGVNLPDKETTKNGFEAQFGINHLGRFYLTKLLLDVIQNSGSGRVINVSSSAHKDCKEINWDDIAYGRHYSYREAYSQSKLANILFTKELQRRVGNKKVKIVSLHPGWVRTEFSKHIAKKWYLKMGIKVVSLCLHFFGKSQIEGAQTTLYCALEDYKKLEGGSYYEDCQVKKESRLACDQENWKKMWNLSEELVAKFYKKKAR